MLIYKKRLERFIDSIIMFIVIENHFTSARELYT